MEKASTENVKNATIQETYSKQKDTLSILEINGLNTYCNGEFYDLQEEHQNNSWGKFDLEKIAMLGNKLHFMMVNRTT